MQVYTGLLKLRYLKNSSYDEEQMASSVQKDVRKTNL